MRVREGEKRTNYELEESRSLAEAATAAATCTAPDPPLKNTEKSRPNRPIPKDWPIRPRGEDEEEEDVRTRTPARACAARTILQGA